MKKRLLLLALTTSKASVAAQQEVSSGCVDASHYPGITFSSDGDTGEKIEVEYGADNAVVSIVKSDDCFRSTFDVESQVTYLQDLHSSYSSTYGHRDAHRLEEQKISLWFSWEREESSSMPRTYMAKSEHLEYFVPSSIAALYFVVILLGLLVLLMTNLCCKSARLSQSDKFEQTAEVARRHPEDKDHKG